MSLIKKDQRAFFKLKDLSGDCNFYGSFRVGNNLKSIENLSLPATGLTNGCYGFMFASADTQTVMILPAKNIKESCYRNMFSDCKSLTTAPMLLNTDSATHCFSAMFARCSSLQNVPNDYLPVTNLESHCYSSMFKGCTNLTTAPELPATTLAQGCYGNMFQDCTGLTSAPALPSTTLATGCYQSMFKGCTSLETSPKIMATTGGTIQWVMEDMFSGCTKLDNLICLITDFYGYAPTNRWLNGVKEPGIFYKNPLATESSIRYNEGNTGNRIPDSWTIVDYAG